VLSFVGLVRGLLVPDRAGKLLGTPCSRVRKAKMRRFTGESGFPEAVRAIAADVQ